MYITSLIPRAARKKSGFAIGCPGFREETLVKVLDDDKPLYWKKWWNSLPPTYEKFVAGWTSRVNTTKTGGMQITIMLSPQAKVMF